MKKLVKSIGKIKSLLLFLKLMLFSSPLLCMQASSSSSRGYQIPSASSVKVPLPLLQDKESTNPEEESKGKLVSLALDDIISDTEINENQNSNKTDATPEMLLYKSWRAEQIGGQVMAYEDMPDSVKCDFKVQLNQEVPKGYTSFIRPKKGQYCQILSDCYPPMYVVNSNYPHGYQFFLPPITNKKDPRCSRHPFTPEIPAIKWECPCPKRPPSLFVSLKLASTSDKPALLEYTLSRCKLGENCLHRHDLTVIRKGKNQREKDKRKRQV